MWHVHHLLGLFSLALWDLGRGRRGIHVNPNSCCLVLQGGVKPFTSDPGAHQCPCSGGRLPHLLAGRVKSQAFRGWWWCVAPGWHVCLETLISQPPTAPASLGLHEEHAWVERSWLHLPVVSSGWGRRCVCKAKGRFGARLLALQTRGDLGQLDFAYQIQNQCKDI